MIIANAKNGLNTGNGTEAGLFIPVSNLLASQFPSLGERDRSEPHVTFLYIGEVPVEKEAHLVQVIQRILGTVSNPVTATLQGLNYFTHLEKQERVAISTVKFDYDMATLRQTIWNTLKAEGFEIKDSFPFYRPHVTLHYGQMYESFGGNVPKGSWSFDKIEVWGLSKLYTIPFGVSMEGKVANKYLNAMKHQTSVELIKFLSQVARNLGVGNDVYIVGGGVRNFVMDPTGLKYPIKDIDVLTDSSKLGIKASEWFAKEVQKAIPVETSLVTNQYGVAIITIKKSWLVGGEDLAGEVIEIANTRAESYTDGGYKPTEVKPADIETDVLRREFTFNTLLWRLQDIASGPDLKAIIDLSGCGLKDLQEGVMRCPRDPNIVFSDDPSRMIRAVKFSIKYGFKIPSDLKDSILRNKEKIRNIPPGHLSNMIINLFYEGGVGKEALLHMKSLGILDVVKDIAQTNRPFREALGNWAEKRADLKFLFDLMDLGMPVGSSIPKNFTEQQKARLRELSVQLTPEEADALLETIDQPGRKIDMMGLITEFGLKGGEIQKLTRLAQQVLLDQPELLNKPDKLEQEVRKQFGGKTASEHAGKFQEYLNSYSFLFGTMAKEYNARNVSLGNSLIPDRSVMLRYTMGKYWAKFIMAGRGLIQAITELKSIPANKAKKFEMAARVFNSIVRIPKDMGKWWEKNEPLFSLVLEAAKWSDKTEADVTQKFQVGPFTVFNTVNLPDAKLREIKDLLEQAIQKIKGLNYPTDFDKVLYGEVFVVGQLSKSNTLAWYVPKDDVFYVRPLMGKRDINVLHNIIHELGHRYWHKFMSTLVKRDWTIYDYQVRNAVRGKVVMPKEGEPVPVLVKTNKGDVKDPIALKVIPGVKYEFDAGNNPFSLKWDIVYKRVLESETAKGFPTRYAMKNPDEHFCEAVASKAVGILKSELEQNFDKVFGKKVVDNNYEPERIFLANRVATRYLQGATFEFNIGEPIWYGKYKNKAGIIKGFDKDPKGNPLVIIEPVPKGRKQDKALQLFRIWKNHSAVKVANRYLAKWEEKIPGGKAEGKEPKDFDLDALLKGQEIEMEHTDDPQVALEITMDHLTEFDDYYDGLEKMEKGLKGKD